MQDHGNGPRAKLVMADVFPTKDAVRVKQKVRKIQYRKDFSDLKRDKYDKQNWGKQKRKQIMH